MSGGGKDPSIAARQDEAARQARITAAVDRINTIFNGGTDSSFNNKAYLAANPDVAANSYWGANPEYHYQQHGKYEGRAAPMDTLTVAPGERQALYDDQKSAVYDVNKLDIDKQYAAAERDNRFGLARAGLMGGSADVDSNALLQDKTNTGLIKAGGLGDAAAASLKMADERSRQGLISMAQSGIDTGTAQSMALRGLDASAQDAQGARTGATIGNLFGDLSSAYLFNQMANGQAAGAQMYGMQGYPNLSTRNSYGGTTS